MKRLIVCDLDGTLSDCKHRQHLAAAGDWEGFHALMHLDPPVKTTLDFIVEAHLHMGCGLLFLTGRPETFRSVTERWLEEACGIDTDMCVSLLMRQKDDYRPDIVIKPELLHDSVTFGAAGIWLEDNIEGWSNDSFLMLEDRDKVVAMWRDKGYTCWQVAEGAF